LLHYIPAQRRGMNGRIPEVFHFLIEDRYCHRATNGAVQWLTYSQ